MRLPCRTACGAIRSAVALSAATAPIELVTFDCTARQNRRAPSASSTRRRSSRRKNWASTRPRRSTSAPSTPASPRRTRRLLQLAPARSPRPRAPPRLVAAARPGDVRLRRRRARRARARLSGRSTTGTTPPSSPPTAGGCGRARAAGARAARRRRAPRRRHLELGRAAAAAAPAPGIAHTIDFVVASRLEKVEKPSREIFDRARALAGVSAEARCVHVGLFALDVQGAVDAGFEAVWIAPPASRRGGARRDAAPLPLDARDAARRARVVWIARDACGRGRDQI